jgi:hypothetical protein
MFPKVPLDGNPFDLESKRHLLPWKDGEKKVDPRLFTDFLWVNTEEIDSDDYWEAELVRQSA